jgi:hypothetical protein
MNKLTSTLTIKETKVVEREITQQLAKLLPKVVKNVITERDNLAAGIRIQNGVKHPTANDPAYRSWVAFDMWNKESIEPTPLLARRLAHELNQASGVVVTDLYLWRKFHGMVK